MAWNSAKNKMSNNLMIGLAVAGVAVVYLFFTEKGKALKTSLMSMFAKKS